MIKEQISINVNNVIACVWDFDKTLISHYMQDPLFEEYGVDLQNFWLEVNALPAEYAKHGITLSNDSASINHFLTYIKNGLFPGLTNKKLREIGTKLKFFKGLPEFFKKIKNFVDFDEVNKKYKVTLEHYIVSNGFAEVIRGSVIAQYVEEVYGCEFIEAPLPPNFLRDGINYCPGKEIQQIGRIIDNTQKTRCLFEINKGCNKDKKIDINSTIRDSNRRIPFENMIYVADGPSDIPSFTVVRGQGGHAYAVYDENSEAQFEQNDRMLTNDRVDAYGPADYTDDSTTVRWIKMKIKQICEHIIKNMDTLIDKVISEPPIHIHE